MFVIIYGSGELQEDSTISKMETVQKEGSRSVKRIVSYYNLDLIIAVAEQLQQGYSLLIIPFKMLFGDRTLNAQTIRMSVIANWLNERRIPLEDVQLMAGHLTTGTTEKYRRKDSEQQRKLINQFHPLK